MTEPQTDSRIALVTGASQGIGAAIAIRLIDEGYRVLIVARSADKLASVSGSAGEAAKSMAGVAAIDLTQPGACEDAVARCHARFGGLDLLVNCAGDTKSGDFLSLSEADFIAGFALKFHAAVNLTRAAWPHLKRAGNGHIVNIIGIGARRPTARYAIGGSVNSALLSFTKTMADRGISDRIRVNGINPGFIDTGRIDVWVDQIAARDGIPRQEARNRLVKEHGVMRIGRPEEIAALVAFLDSANAAYIHGAILDIDGGATKSI